VRSLCFAGWAVLVPSWSLSTLLFSVVSFFLCLLFFSLYVCSARVELRFACLSGIEAEVTLKPKCIEPQCVELDWAKEIAHSFAVLGIEYFCLQQERRRRYISF